ncbi:UDP-GlcNAc:betaGal beta-1,3-N-acetylglucosaminyltransferase 7-like [Lineus longissimus]|uniref:UDP-GlcNAc:betaGal beta-1,3-N-acetylglucosaminyltransferase 7-like n=1 Tax=Lineus longissimus TaxID=88925 RepID=UPI00315D43DD
MFKIDDDVIAFPKNIVDYAISLEAQNKTVVYDGFRSYNQFFSRKKGKWAIPYEVYRNKTVPPYNLGFAVLFSQEAINAIYRASFHVPRVYGTPRQRFPVEDVFTGICAKYAGIKPRRNRQFLINVRQLRHRSKVNQCAILSVLAIHGLRDYKLDIYHHESEDLRRKNLCPDPPDMF